MIIINVLNIIAPIAITVFLIGVGVRLGRFAWALATRRRFRGVSPTFEHAPRRLGFFEALHAVLFGPIKHFYKRANPTWGRGYLYYHIAIITEVTGYTISALIVFAHIIFGKPVPDVALHMEESFNYTPANLLALIFGNGESLQSHFLFGDFAPYFVGITWIAVGFAVVGNLHLMVTLLRKRSGAVVADIDQAARGIRTPGRLPWDRLLVRSIIFCIIWTELFARLNLVHGIVYVHALLGLALFTLLPFTYLFHMIYNFIAVYYAVQRRMERTIA
ncbi:hypothetical protein [Roseiflexus castenholzii]|jgi:nitrate reductase gamma subunit|uniref:Nitrate reductase gamma subunit n=1 Tax=Roseiflexus castenholzii (strain DSM 13941 / HLO8) TaxID=383372 RepID=A7NHR6_ROSCS|nr:hypothetical protein [Roseiflexus castenholzii]ABU57013.1 conserved hypothetical protein [Roseiflexus castenholzii DSM 13941]